MKNPGPDGKVIQVRNLEKSFSSGAAQTFVLRRIHLDIAEGELVAPVPVPPVNAVAAPGITE